MHPSSAEQTDRPRAPVLDLTRATSLTTDVLERIDDLFDDHPLTDDQRRRAEAIRAALKGAWSVVVANAPDCPDRTVAQRTMRDVMWWALSAVMHMGKY